MPTRSERVLLPLLAGAALAGMWHLGVRLSGTTVFPSPRAVLAGAGALARSGVLFRYAADSLLRVLGGFSLAVLLGVPLGLLMGRSRDVSSAVNPLIQLLRPISPLAWIPIAIVLFGITNLAAIALIFLASLFPITVATADAVGAVPRKFLWAGQNFGLSRTEQLLRVVLPAALPRVLIGLRIALGIAWMVVAAEMIAVDSGLGYLIVDSRNAGKRYDLVVAGMLLIGVIGLCLDVAMRRLERLRALRWGFRGA